MPGREKINNLSNSSVRILIAPLDWGLGHTTRCLPVIKKLKSRGCEILVAGNTTQAALLTAEIPELKTVDLKGYGLKYSTSARQTRWKIFFQIPKILTSIKSENKWLKSLLQHEKIDIVISDNRFGLHDPSIFSIFITHQLHIQFPWSKWIENRLQKWNYHFIEKFDCCWVPDYAGEKNIAGDLSHPLHLPAVPVQYTGTLSRFERIEPEGSPDIDLLILISGPEPQRTIFESLLISELKSFSGNAVLIRGLPVERKTLPSLENIRVYNHLATADLQELFRRTRLVISRAGYSTVMDLVRLNKKSVLVPTPGQTEQEYLGQHLMEKKFCVCISQENFSLQSALQAAAGFSFTDFNGFDNLQYETAIDNLLERFSEKKQ